MFASAERGTTAIDPIAAGNITVTTGNFRLADGGVVNALTDNSGRGGNITINAKTFTATGGGQVLTTARNSGSAGDITLNISDSITISGFDPNFNQRFEQARIDEAKVDGLPTDIVNNQGSASGIFANTTSQSTGKGGTLKINTQDLTVQKRLVPAQGWIFNDKGQVLLTAYDPTKTGPQRSWQEPASCAKR